LIIYDFKCKSCGAEYYYRAEVYYQGEKLPCPNCGGEDHEINEYNPLADNYTGWDTCSSGSFA
jgi:hypothetical protein